MKNILISRNFKRQGKKSFAIEGMCYIIISLFMIPIYSKYFPQFVHFLISWFSFDPPNIKLYVVHQ